MFHFLLSTLIVKSSTLLKTVKETVFRSFTDHSIRFETELCSQLFFFIVNESVDECRASEEILCMNYQDLITLLMYRLNTVDRLNVKTYDF